MGRLKSPHLARRNHLQSPSIPIGDNLVRISWIGDKCHWGINTYYNDIPYYLGIDDRWNIRMYKDISQEIAEFTWPTEKKAALFYEQHCNKIIREGMYGRYQRGRPEKDH